MSVALIALTLAAAARSAVTGSTNSPVQVYHHGEAGFRCIRIPVTIQAQGVLLSFASARDFTGDSCFPRKYIPNANNYSAFVVKRSTDGGATWGGIIEIKRNPVGMSGSPEGSAVFDALTNTTIAIWRSDVSNATTGLGLWQAESADAGVSWTTPHPLVVPRLLPKDVTSSSHIAPGGGIQLHAPGTKHAGRLLNVLILQGNCREDVVIYSDDGGATWEISSTRLPNNGEAQIAELGADQLIFDGRSKLAGYPRGLATSVDGGATWRDIRFTNDTTSGTSCLASLLAVPATHQAPSTDAVPSSSSAGISSLSSPLQTLYFSHPAANNRSHGVILKSEDGALTWQLLKDVTPENPSSMFAYSSLTALLDPFEPATGVGAGVGMTYETGDSGCTSVASACQIVFRRIQI
jgi:sialidase-1